MVMAAVKAPVAVGVKWPWIVQFAPAATLDPHVFAKRNDDALVPVTAMLEIDSGAVPVLVNVTDCDALVVPTAWLANVKLVADSDTAGLPPAPESATVCDPPATLSVIVMAAVIVPVVVGAKWPWIVQFAPADTLVPQLFENANEEAFAPVTAMLVT
jgi:hypothetical protein